ncbi:hypothetical protein D3C75_1354130 [compost metagenome]
MGEWARSEHIDYLEISLDSSAQDASHSTWQLRCSGPLRAFERLKPLCQKLSSSLTYLGTDCGAILEP